MAKKFNSSIFDFCSYFAGGLKSVLRISYLLTAVDGTIFPTENARFRTILVNVLGGDFSDVETIMYVSDLLADARRLADLRAIYPDDSHILKAFGRMISDDFARIGLDALAWRRAFATWIGMCASDRDYSQVERRAMRFLLEKFEEEVAGRLKDGPVVSRAYIEKVETALDDIGRLERRIQKLSDEGKRAEATREYLAAEEALQKYISSDED